MSSSGSVQIKPGVVPGSHHHTNEPQYYSPGISGDRGDELVLDSQASSSDVPVAHDSVKEGWLNCKISNVDGKVHKFQINIFISI